MALINCFIYCLFNPPVIFKRFCLTESIGEYFTTNGEVYYVDMIKYFKIEMWLYLLRTF